MKKTAILAATLGLILAAPAHASEAQVGTINSIYGTWNGAVLFNTTGARTALPSCQGPGLQTRFAIDGSTVAGQAAVSVLLSAYAMGKRVIVVGTGTCSIWGDTETVSFFVVED